MSDLDVMIRQYYETAAPPVEAEEVLSRLEPGLEPPRRRGMRFRSGWYAFAAALVMVMVVVGASTLVLRGDSEEVTAQPPVEPVTLSDGTWERTVVSTGFEVYDLRSTSFGLVAAAGADGVWISPDGSDWRQALVAPYEPPERTWEGEPARLATDVETVAEYDGALYAFGTIWTDPDGSEGPEGESRLVTWRSDDGRTWEEILISGASFAHGKAIEAVAGEDGLLVYARLPSYRRLTYRSYNGEDWTRLGTETGEQLWAISRFGEGYVALGEKPYDQGIVLTSTAGVTWEESGPWTITRPGGQPQPMNYSVWALVDLFETPYGLVAVGTPEPWNSQEAAWESHPGVLLATSIDGINFEVLDHPTGLFQLEDDRENRWPPFRPPEGAMFGDQIVLQGHSYPDNFEEHAYHQWVWTPPQG